MNCFLHGAVGHHKDWANFINSIPDKNGFAPNLYKYVNYDLKRSARIINSLNPDAQTLIGYSMGGRIALHCLLEDNSNWKRAVIISAHTGLVSEKEQQIRIKKDNDWASNAINKWDTFISKWEEQSIFKNSHLIKRNYSLYHQRANIALSFQNWSLGHQKFLEPYLDKIRIPILWIVGELDLKFLEIACRACKILPNCDLIKFKSTGHRVPWDNPDLTTKAINSFIK